MSTTPSPILSLTGIVKTFPGVRALDEAGLKVYPGQVMALLGENGAGKSTLMKVLTGIYQPTAAPSATAASRFTSRDPATPRIRGSASSTRS